MKNITKLICVTAFSACSLNAAAQCVYLTSNEGWLNSEYYLILDIDAAKLTDASLPKSTAQSGKFNAADADFKSGVFTTPVLDEDEAPTAILWPVTYNNCAFAPTQFTSAYDKWEEYGEEPSGKNDPCTKNDNTVMPGNVYGKQGFVELSRLPAAEGTDVSRHGSIVINDLPAVERIQWSYSSTSWKRGVKCDIKIGDGEWKQQRWEPSDKTTLYATFSEQGYSFDEYIGLDADSDSKVSIRFRIWDGDETTWAEDELPWIKPIDPLAQAQTVRIHQIKVFSGVIPGKVPDAIASNQADNFNMYQSEEEIVLSDEANVEMYTVEGKLVLTQSNSTRINVTGLSTGIYLVKANLTNGLVKNLKVVL